jgi:xylulose-5-phosphate/fructose-6-phosphate phosphoketolase
VIRNIQSAARRGQPILKPRWPVIILRTPKGLSGPKSVHGEILEGSFRSHQVPLPLAKTSTEELDLLVNWLGSYRPSELFNGDGTPVDDILKLIPERNDKKLGQRREAYKAYTPLEVPDWRSTAVERGTQESCMKRVGQYLRDVIVKCVLPLPKFGQSD